MEIGLRIRGSAVVAGEAMEGNDGRADVDQAPRRLRE